MTIASVFYIMEHAGCLSELYHKRDLHRINVNPVHIIIIYFSYIQFTVFFLSASMSPMWPFPWNFLTKISQIFYLRLEISIVIKIQVMVFHVMAPCTVMW